MGSGAGGGWSWPHPALLFFCQATEQPREWSARVRASPRWYRPKFDQEIDPDACRRFASTTAPLILCASPQRPSSPPYPHGIPAQLLFFLSHRLLARDRLRPIHLNYPRFQDPQLPRPHHVPCFRRGSILVPILQPTAPHRVQTRPLVCTINGNRNRLTASLN